MADEAIEAEGLAYAYGTTTALDGVTLSVPAGSTTALLGPNGAGKTTFVRLVTGVLAPKAGRLRVLGGDAGAVDRERLGVLPQAYDPPERLTPRELLRHAAGLYDDAHPPGRLLDDLGLEAVADRRYHRLSGGERRRTCLALALVNDPELLVLDEPTAEIDPAGKRAIWSTLPELVGGGTLLVTTHDMAEAGELADRVAFFHEGSLVTAGPAEAVVADRLGGRRLVLRTDDPARLREHLGTGEVRPGDLVVRAVEFDRLPELLEAVRDAGVEIDRVRWERPPLEDLFLDLEGGDVRP